MKLHKNLQWKTIIARIEKEYGERFRIDTAYNSVYEYIDEHNAYVHYAGFYDKKSLIEIFVDSGY